MKDLAIVSQTQQSMLKLQEAPPTCWQDFARRGVVPGIIATLCLTAFPAAVHASAVTASAGVEEVAKQISSSNGALGRQAQLAAAFDTC